MATKVIMPQGGQDINVGTVVRWLIKEGDPVKKGEVICEVETEKAVFEVEAPVDGVLKKIIVKEGQEARIFSVIGIIGDQNEVINLETILAEDEKEASGVDVSQLRKKLATIQEQEDKRINVSPRAKKLAQEKGIPLALLKGSGPRGRIIEKDVLEFSEKQVGEEGAHAEASPAGTQMDGGKKVPMTKVRKIIARKMQKSKQIVPHFYVTVGVDMTEATEFREDFNRKLKNSEPALTLTDLIVRACALALEEFPYVNSSVLDEENVILWNDINIGIAVGLDSGLVVPVLEKADKLTLSQIAEKSRYLVSMIKDGKQASLAQGRFTVSNMGMLHVENFVAIINHPETAILAISSTEKKVVVLDGGLFGIRDRMNMTLSVDHRAADGVMAARFMNKVKFHLENPKSLL
jgi:pyruvate dehydrogenase E2 component (dihydrolipoamide acetyltransferase)